VLLSRQYLCLRADGVIFGVAVCTPGGDEVDDPAAETRGANPRNSRYDQPDNSNQDTTVVNLPQSGNEQAKKARNDWIAHVFAEPPPALYDTAVSFVRSPKGLKGLKGLWSLVFGLWSLVFEKTTLVDKSGFKVSTFLRN
jgi:hypothetical protein